MQQLWNEQGMRQLIIMVRITLSEVVAVFIQIVSRKVALCLLA